MNDLCSPWQGAVLGRGRVLLQPQRLLSSPLQIGSKEQLALQGHTLVPHLSLVLYTL